MKSALSILSHSQQRLQNLRMLSQRRAISFAMQQHPQQPQLNDGETSLSPVTKINLFSVRLSNIT
jgi:hypothetical protein